MPPTDEHLLAQCARGDREAFLALYDRYAPRAFGLILRLVRDRADAEDVLQEVMWEIWTRADRYNPALGSVATWALMIARSRAIDMVRKRSAGINPASSAPESLVGHPATPGASRSSASDPRLNAHFGSLPAEQQVVIRMAFIHGLSRNQIATALDLPVGTVKTRIRLGIRRLADLSTREGPAQP